MRAAGEPRKAEALWTAIARARRAVEARLAVADVRRVAVESELISGDRRVIGLAFQRAESFLIEALQNARNEREQAELLLAQVRLNLVPNAGEGEIHRPSSIAWYAWDRRRKSVTAPG